jgi:hypothetical protein
LFAQYLRLKIKYAFRNHLLFKNEKLLVVYLDLLILCQIRQLVFEVFLRKIERLNEFVPLLVEHLQQFGILIFLDL